MNRYAFPLIALAIAGCSFPGLVPSTPEESVRIRYDTERGTTLVDAAVVFRSFAPPHTARLYQSFEGRERPETMWDAFLAFGNTETHTRAWRFRENHDLVLLLEDGVPRRYTGHYEGTDGASIVRETITFSVPIEDLRLIAMAGTVRGRLGGESFEWREREVAVVARFLEVIID